MGRSRAVRAYLLAEPLSRDPTLLGSIVGQDYCKLLLLAIILVGLACVTLLNIPALAHSSFLHLVVDFLKVK